MGLGSQSAVRVREIVVHIKDNEEGEKEKREGESWDNAEGQASHWGG